MEGCTSHNGRRYAMSARLVRKAAARQSRRVHPAGSPARLHRSLGDLRCGMLPASVGEDRPFGFHGWPTSFPSSRALSFRASCRSAASDPDWSPRFRSELGAPATRRETRATDSVARWVSSNERRRDVEKRPPQRSDGFRATSGSAATRNGVPSGAIGSEQEAMSAATNDERAWPVFGSRETAQHCHNRQ